MKTLAALMIAAAGLPGACTLSMKVTEVHDGDTFKGRVLKRSGKCDPRDEISIRIGKIDAPEMKQPFGPAARDAARVLLLDRTVHVVISGKSYNRLVADYIGTDRYVADVARQLVIDGWAWHYAPARLSRLWRFTRMRERDKELAVAQQASREAKRGIWAQGSPERPWVYRERQHQ